MATITKNIEIQGLQETVNKFQDIKGASQKAVIDGIEEWAKGICLGRAKEKCPVKSGALRDSGGVQRTETEVAIGFGGPAAPYAIVQHEETSFHHTVGEDHWLEKAANETAKELKPIIERRIGDLAK